MSRKNIKIIIVSFVVLSFMGFMTINRTLAYYNYKTQALKNNLQVGKVTTAIIEDTVDINGSKKPYVQNKDICDCIVRMRYEISPSEAPVEIDKINDNWVDGNDGFYYYQGVLKGAPNGDGEKTDPLFEKYTFDDSSNFVTKYGNTFQIILYQEAVQTKAVNIEGKTVSAIKNGAYDQQSAISIWEIYK